MEAPIPQLFGLIPTGSPCLVVPTAVPSQTSFVYTLPLLPNSKPFSHITVFLLPGVTLPPDTAAAVYISLPPSASHPTQSFKFLGGIGEGKESAVFKISGLGAGEGGEITIGISLESASSVSAQIAALAPSSPQISSPSNAMVLASSTSANVNAKPDTLLLAQRIIKNAFNFLASFSGNVNGGIEVVPLKAFEEWWKKFEGRVRSDPGFLERGSDGD